MTRNVSHTPGLSHNEAIDAICGCSATVTALSYQEAIEGYFKLRDLHWEGSAELLAVCQAFIAQIGPNGYYPGAGKPLTDKMRIAIASATGIPS